MAAFGSLNGASREVALGFARSATSTGEHIRLSHWCLKDICSEQEDSDFVHMASSNGNVHLYTRNVVFSE